MKDRQFEILGRVIDSCVLEHEKQIAKWGVQDVTSFEWLTFLMEEVGELAEAISEFEYRGAMSDEIYKEAVQVSTLALKIAEMSKYLPTYKRDLE